MLDPLSNVPVLVWCEDDQYIASCVLIPDCIVRARTRERALAAVRKRIRDRLDDQPVERWALPGAYEVVYVPALSARPRQTTGEVRLLLGEKT